MVVGGGCGGVVGVGEAREERGSLIYASYVIVMECSKWKPTADS